MRYSVVATTMSPAAGSRIMSAVLILTITLFIIPTAKGALPGRFFWRPQLTVNIDKNALKQKKANPYYVMISGYNAGMTLMALTTIIEAGNTHKHLDIGSAHFYTNAYRWGLRYLRTLPKWIAGRGNFVHTHHVWDNRFNFMHSYVPEWIRPLFFYVDKSEWDEVIEQEKKYQKYAETEFATWYKYPSRTGPDY